MRFSVERKRKPTRAQRPAVRMGHDKTSAEALVAEMGKRAQEFEAKRKQEPGDWSKEGCVLAYERGLQEGEGLHPPPHVLPYKPLGVVDVSRDRSLLPAQYRVYKRPHSRREGCRKETSDPVLKELPKSMDSVSLPLNVKSASWNGEQWCRLGFSPRNAKVANGYAMLRDEVTKSHNRLHHTKMGRFFLDGLYLEKPRAKGIYYLQPSEAIETNFHPYIPPLPLANIAQYQIEAQIEDNKHLLGLYQDEAKRTLYSYRKASAKASMENSPVDKRKQFGGLPFKACSKLALKTLDKILDDSMKFEILQAKYNFDLLKQLAATKSTRAYTFPRNYAELKELQNAKDFICEPGMTSQRAKKFRSLLLKFPWYKVLISLIHHNGQHPNKSEIYILDHIRFVIQTQNKFDATNYCDLICAIQSKKLDMNSLSIHSTLHFVKEAICMTDMEIIEKLFERKVTSLPHWLEAQGNLVTLVKQKLETKMLFPSKELVDSTPLYPSQPLDSKPLEQTNLESSPSSARLTTRIAKLERIQKQKF